jgi:hypothetical protein
VRALHADATLGALAPGDPAASSGGDLALGRERTSQRSTLDSFGVRVGGTIYRAWKARGLANQGSGRIPEFEGYFREALAGALARGARLKFDLTDLDVARALGTDAPLSAKGITAWELRQIVKDPQYRAITDFYRQDDSGALRRLGSAERRALGLDPSAR